MVDFLSVAVNIENICRTHGNFSKLIKHTNDLEANDGFGGGKKSRARSFEFHEPEQHTFELRNYAKKLSRSTSTFSGERQGSSYVFIS